jgi:hypothetical protein
MGWTTATFSVSGWSGRRERFALASGPVIATTGLVCLTAVALLPHLLAAAGTNSMKGVAVSGGTLNGKSYVIVAANEDYPNVWPSGLVYSTQPSDPTQLWAQTSVDSTYRAVHEISSGSFGAGPYFIAAEQEQL